MMNKQSIRNITGDYEAWLINSLKNKKEAAIYLQLALDEYQEDGNVAAILLALKQVGSAQGSRLI